MELNVQHYLWVLGRAMPASQGGYRRNTNGLPIHPQFQNTINTGNKLPAYEQFAPPGQNQHKALP